MPTIRGPKLEGRLSDDLEDNLKLIAAALGVGESFDVLQRELEIGGRRAALVFIDGLAKDDVMTDVLRHLLGAERADLTPVAIEAVFRKLVPYIEVSRSRTFEEIIRSVLSGPLALFIDGCDEAILIDARTYPARDPQEPELERVLRGSRDGFVETIIFNTALIRRRVRDPNLRVELLSVGTRSPSDVALLYIKDVANPDLVSEVRDRVNELEVGAVPMAEKTVEEFLIGPKTWWNPFPLVRYTERPDVAAVHLFEGHVLLVVDTSPSAIILPTTLFHHLQHAEEYRENVLVGAYLRLIRLLALIVSWIGPPLWLAVVLNREFLPASLAFLGPKDPGAVPLGLQFVLAEVGLDLIRLALIHVPNALSTSLGFIGAILLGEVATNVGLFAPETILYVALAALGTFATPSLEFAMAVRLSRLGLLILAWTLGPFGLLGGVIVQFLVLAFTKAFRVPYLWPLLPLNAAALFGAVIRKPVPLRTARPSVLRPQDDTVAQAGQNQPPDEGEAERGRRKGRRGGDSR